MSRSSRKWDHINLAVDSPIEQIQSPWDDLRFVHHALPESSMHEVQLDTMVAGRKWTTPIYVNAMTGGAVGTESINAELAEIANEYGLSMAVGSQRAALLDEELQHTFRVVRQKMKNGIVMANIGADVSLEFAIRAVDMLEADYLQIHLNPVQELIMPEGDRDFRGHIQNIEKLLHYLPIPIIVKEVGFGMAREIYEDLISIGVKVLDVGGRGGTNFSWIENKRRDDYELQYLNEWGQTTLVSLLEAQSYHRQMEWLASGGIKNSLDMVKSFALGARAVGVAGPVLRMLQKEGAKAVRWQIEEWLHGLRILFTLLGVRDLEGLTKTPLIVSGDAAAWCNARGIDLQTLASRRHKFS